MSPSKTVRTPYRTGFSRGGFSWSAYALIAPFFGLTLAFGIFPLLFSLYISFCDWNPLSGVSKIRWDGLWAYQYIATDPFYWPALWRSLSTGLAASVPQHLIAIPLAFALHLVYRRSQGVLGTVLFLPYVTSPMAAGGAIGLVFLIVYRPLEALVGALSSLPALGAFIPQLDQSLAYNAITQLWITLGWNILLYLMALGTVPPSLYEAAKVDGANLGWQFRAIALPLMRPMIFVAFTISFLQGVQANVFQPAFAGLRETTLPGYVFRTGFFEMDFGLAAAQTWTFFAAVLMVVFLVYLLIGRHFTSLDVSAHGEADPGALHLHKATVVVLKLVLAVAIAVSVLPVLSVILGLTRSGENIPLAIGQEFQNNYADLMGRVPDFWRNIWNTTYVSVLAALGAMLTSSLAGFAFALLEFRYRRALYAAVLCIMLFPSALNIIPTTMVMHVLGWMDQARAMWLPATASAFGIFLTRQYLASAVPGSIIEAARMDGAGTGLIYRKMILPLAQPVLVLIGLLTFIGTWNSSMNALAVFKQPETQLILQAMSTVIRPDGDGTGAFRFGVALATIPTLLVFMVTAHQVKRGMNLSSTAPTNAKRPVLPRRFPYPRTAVASGHPAERLLFGADGVRAVACLMVIAHHLAQRLDQSAQPRLLQEVQAFVLTGHVGVSAFFVLSGMLLSLPFWRRYLTGQPSPGLREYFRRRALRILPGFYASLALSVLLSVAFVQSAEQPWLRLVSAATFTSAFHYLTFFPADLNGPLWSIGFEVVCYALMPLGMLVLFRGLPQRGLAWALLYWLGVLALAMLLHQWILANLVPSPFARGWEYGIVGGAKYWMPRYNPVGLFGHYVFGVLAAGLIAHGQLSATPRHIRYDLLAVGAAVGVLMLLWLARRLPDFALSIGDQPYFFPYFPLLVAALLASLPFSRVVGRAFDNTFFRFTARVSFGLYIWHYLILELIRLLHQPRYGYMGIQDLTHFAGLTVAALLLAYGAAFLSYRHIEEPFLPKGPAFVAATGRSTRPSVVPSAPAATEGSPDPLSDSRGPVVGLPVAILALAVIALVGGGVWLTASPRAARGAQLIALIQNLTADPRSLPVKSVDERELFRYEKTRLGTTALVWHDPQEWWLEVEAPLFVIDDIAPQRRLLSREADLERFEIMAGPLAGHIVTRDAMEVNVYSKRFYRIHQP